MGDLIIVKMSELLKNLDFLHQLEFLIREQYYRKINNLPTVNTNEQLIGALDQTVTSIKIALVNDFIT